MSIENHYFIRSVQEGTNTSKLISTKTLVKLTEGKENTFKS